MRLPHSAENVQPGFYFYPSQDLQSFDLLSVESKNVILCRVNGNWKPYGFIKQFWENPSDNEIPLHDVKKAVSLVDEYQAAGKSLTRKEISSFDVMYQEALSSEQGNVRFQGNSRVPLENLGWEIEKGKSKIQKIERPLLHGDNGIPRVKYEIDGWHNSHKAVMEVESGRGWQGNAVYRDLIRASIMQEVDYLLLGVRQQYKYANVTQNDFEKNREQVEVIYASGRLNLPFKGLLVFGW